MRVLLVGPDREENLSIRYLSSSLLSAGFDAELASFNDPDDGPAVVDAAYGVDIVGLSICFQARAREFLELARLIRRVNASALMIAGGHFASCAARELLEHNPELDLVAIHEGERTIVEVAEWRKRGNGPVSVIRGIAWRDGSRVRFSPPRPIVEDLDSLPAPDRRGPVHLVAGVPTAYLFGSRGCLGACDYCCISTLHALAPGRRFRQRDPGKIADEVADLYRGRGVRQFIFHDDNFLVPSETLNHRRLDALERAFRDRGIDGIALYMKCRPGDASRSILTRLRGMGLVRLFMGIESSTAQGYASLGRRQAVEESEKALRACGELGISAQYTLLVFHPDATLGTIRSDIRFMREHIDHPLNFGRVELHAGTPLERRMITAGLARGDYLARSYSLVDPTADFACALWKLVFRERCTGETGLMNSAILLNYLAAVMRRFYPGPRVRRLYDDIESWRLRTSGTSLDLLEKLVDWCDAVPDPRDTRLPGFLRELAAEQEVSARVLLGEGDELRRRLDSLTLGMVGLEERNGRMRRIAGSRGSVARHMAAVALAFQVAGTVPAFGCCDMEERVLDVDHDGLADDLEQQVFGTNPKVVDGDLDAISDAQEDHDGDGVSNLEEQVRIEGLSRAAETNDIKALRRLIQQGVELDATHPNWGEPALAIAARSGFIDGMAALLGAGASVDAAAYPSGTTPLMAAASGGTLDAAKALLDAGAGVNATSKLSGTTPLLAAARPGGAEMVRFLLKAGARVNVRDRSGESALSIAVNTAGIDVVEALLEAGADANTAVQSTGETLLMAATKAGKTGVMQLLLEAGADANGSVKSTGETPLMAATKAGRVEAVRLLLAAGADANVPLKSTGETPLVRAVSGVSPLSRYVDIVKMLLEAGADANGSVKPTGMTPLMIATRAGSADTVRVLLNAGADVNAIVESTGETPLMRASFGDNGDVVQALLDAGADVNAAAKSTGMTPLMIAAGVGRTEIVMTLLAAGAEVNAAVKSTGETPLMIAAVGDTIDIVKLLLDANADIETKDRSGKTALMLAEDHGYAGIARMIEDAQRKRKHPQELLR